MAADTAVVPIRDVQPAVRRCANVVGPKIVVALISEKHFARGAHAETVRLVAIDAALARPGVGVQWSVRVLFAKGIAFIKTDAGGRAKTGYQRRGHIAGHESAEMPMFAIRSVRGEPGRELLLAERRTAKPAIIPAFHDPADAHALVAVVVVVAQERLAEGA